jgi:Domain of unknown function DUF29
MSTLYATDFYSWTREQAAMLRRAADQRLNAVPELDWHELAQEVEDLGRSLERELYSRFSVLLVHLLKWRYQPSLRGFSWELTIARQRFELSRLLAKNPGLKRKAASEFGDAYQAARLQAAKETGLALTSMPTDCPFEREQVLDEAFLPEDGT